MRYSSNIHLITSEGHEGCEDSASPSSAPSPSSASSLNHCSLSPNSTPFLPDIFPALVPPAPHSVPPSAVRSSSAALETAAAALAGGDAALPPPSPPLPLPASLSRAPHTPDTLTRPTTVSVCPEARPDAAVSSEHSRTHSHHKQPTVDTLTAVNITKTDSLLSCLPVRASFQFWMGMVHFRTMHSIVNYRVLKTDSSLGAVYGTSIRQSRPRAVRVQGNLL